MAGWRVGAAVGNPQILRNLYVLKTNQDSGHFLPVLDAATEAMCGDQSWLKDRNEVYRQRRDEAVQGLRALGLDVEKPLGSIYVWSPVPSGWSASDFVTAALEQAQVSLTPGSFFGKGGEGYMRISLTAPAERIAEAMGRLERWLNR
jgi:LL-diaminopimelate aminotransferase